LVNQDLMNVDYIFKAQSEFIFDERGHLLIDYVGRLENFDSDIVHIKNNVEFKVKIIHKNKASTNLHYSNYYDEEAKMIIRKLYLKDVVNFDYKFLES